MTHAVSSVLVCNFFRCHHGSYRGALSVTPSVSEQMSVQVSIWGGLRGRCSHTKGKVNTENRRMAGKTNCLQSQFPAQVQQLKDVPVM